MEKLILITLVLWVLPRFKEVELSGAFSGSGSFGKGNDSTAIIGLMCFLVKVLIIKKEENVFHLGFDKDILATNNNQILLY